MRQSFKARPKTFLDGARRQWQFDAFAWLLRGCGGFPRFTDTTLVLPVPEHFPETGMNGHAGAAALFRLVRDHAGMADWPCIAEPDVSPRAADAGDEAPRQVPDRMRVIRYPPDCPREMLVAHFAHELARYLVESLDEPPPGGAILHEPGVDLATVFIGFGAFMANSAACGARWDLNECELVHALALFCQLRKIAPEAAEPHLNAHVRKYLRVAMRDLAQFDRDFHGLRSVFPVIPIDAGECTLPSLRA
jgi:hypothetical protein